MPGGGHSFLIEFYFSVSNLKTVIQRDCQTHPFNRYYPYKKEYNYKIWALESCVSAPFASYKIVNKSFIK